MRKYYLHIQVTGLSGRLHPTLDWVQTTQDVAIIRPHIKMLSGDYQCYAYLGKDRGTDPSCRLCQALSINPTPAEDLEHLLSQCRATAETRARYIPDLLNILAAYFPTNSLVLHLVPNILTQFLLDCSSLNLPTDTRIPTNHHSFITITRQCSVMINGIHRDRCRQLKTLH